MSVFLKGLALTAQKQATGTGYVVPLIDQVLLLGDNSEDRRDGCFHPSDLSYKFCPRAWSLYNFHPEGYAVKEAGTEARGQRIFDCGHSFHARMQEWLSRKPGVLWGTWKRPVGVDPVTDEVVWQYAHRTFKPAGGGWVYDEVTLRHPARRILGSTDGILVLDRADGTFVPSLGRRVRKYGLEGKTIKSDGFTFLREAVKDAHADQTRVYMECLEDEVAQLRADGTATDIDDLPLEGFVVLYENKNDQHLKEFFVANDPDERAAFFRRVERRMHEALQYERDGTHPHCRCEGGKPSALCKAFRDD